MVDGRVPVRVELLGPLRLVVDGAPVEVPGPKRRAVLALLALAQGRTVTVDHLVDALWPAEVPESGRQALHTHISRLRGHLGPASARLQTHREGYRLDLDADEIDLARARALLSRGRAGLADAPAGASAQLREAHALWRGPVLADLADVAPLAAAAGECAELHREVTDALVAAAVTAGRAAEVLGLAGAAAAEDPLREPAALLLMRALAATGQAPEALRTGREYRRRLAEETGLDPSPALGELEREIAGGAAGPPPATVGSPARPATRLIGREATVASLHRLLAAERLVTLVGPGGVGKTRVAMEVARSSGPAPMLMLAPVTEPAAVPHALAAALHLSVVQGDVLGACLAVLADRRGLLVIDNCEHLLGTVRETVEAVLAACPGLSVLATSREPLGLATEYTSRLPPLPLPGTGADLAEVPSVAVFLERARRVRPGPAPGAAELAMVGEIVARLDGMPLAIELAAGRLSTFSLTDLHGRLDRSLDLLGAGRSGDDRHRTLRSTVEWSYRLLAPDEQRLFRHLSVFVDGVDLDTAEHLAADLGPDGDPGTGLARLVDASMVDADFSDGTRFRMLETLRAFGLDRLAAEGEYEAAVGRLLTWAVTLTSWFGVTTDTEREPEADAVLRREMPNLRAAWRAARDRGDRDTAAAMLACLFDAVGYRDLLEIRGWAAELADDPALEGHERAAAVLGIAAEAAYHAGDHPRADRLARDGLARAGGGTDGWSCLSTLAVTALARAEYDAVVELALAAADVSPRPGENLSVAALAMAYAGDLDRARETNERARAGAVSPSMVSFGAYVAGEIEGRAGAIGAAEEHYVRAVELARGSGATFLVGVATVGLLSARARAGHVADTLRGYREVIDYFAGTGNWTHLWATLRDLAELLDRLGDDRSAAVLRAAADRAPDAPAVGPGTIAVSPPVDLPVPGRDDVLDIARRAIELGLRGSAPGDAGTSRADTPA